ncbi:MAG: hypothetical protein HONBIEJF_00231 [Fimbriimonadaceae bacterium]|nr:hypothetical protein [Fimbriimonadaceae bacterium]
MTPNKARELFSAHLEGELSGERRNQFEAKLASDAELRREFMFFKDAIASLETSRNQSIEIPADLHERISRVVDRHIYETKQRHIHVPWWRRLTLVATAATAIVGAIIAFKSGGETFGADPTGLSGGGTGQFELVHRGDAWFATYRSVGKENFAIMESATGKALYQAELNDRKVESELANPHETPGLVTVRMGATKVVYVAIPGTARQTERTGKGTLLDLAKAVSGFYGLPVEVRTNKTQDEVEWDFKNADPVSAISTSLVKTTLGGVRQGETIIIE